MSDSERMKFWFGKNQSADDEIRDKFGADLEAFGAGELDEWRDCPLSAAAGIILGDQFTRNVYRGSPKSFDFDPRVREWTLGLVKSGEHRRMPGAMRLFVLLPLTHHENLESHEIMSKELAQWKADVEATEPPAPELLKFIAIATQV
ncbi:hypothetical protein QBZ16_000288 [Prototheca wickerhamii]|uniref:DUF924 domain-containing protein n=1 Tax=Prototheca wickerhamii TaxID=3111 RepID=A0AAD9INW6_PROWI|nr:hypothetical protein QBZ16_000288 [Prototheca wickerhamii]